MALTEIPIELSSTPSIVDGGNATAITIDSSENVGIGTSSPSSSAGWGTLLEVSGTTNAGIKLTETDTANGDYSLGVTAGTFRIWDETASAFRLTLDGSGNVGIGTATANRKLEIAGNNNGGAKANYIRITDTDTSATLDNQQGGIEFYTNDNSPGIAASMEVLYAGSGGGGEITFNTAAHSSAGVLEAMRIDASGNVGIGTASPTTSLDVQGAIQASEPGGDFIRMQTDGTNNIFDVNSGAYVFRTGGFTERMRIDSSGSLLVGSTGTTLGGSAVIAAGVQSSHTTGSQTMTVYNSSTSCGANGIFLVGTARTANSAFDIFNCWTAGVSDKEFKVRGDGNVFADGTFSGGGADYAEFFEWLDGNSSAEDRRGNSVVLDSGKIRVATSEDDASQIIGVISANPAMIGDNDMERWRGKYLRDDFGSYDLDSNGDKQLSPDYDEAQSYVSRENRVEWDIVGLMGKLRIHKGQPTGSNWIKIKDISAGIEEWLVR